MYMTKNGKRLKEGTDKLGVMAIIKRFFLLKLRKTDNPKKQIFLQKVHKKDKRKSIFKVKRVHTNEQKNKLNLVYHFVIKINKCQYMLKYNKYNYLNIF